MRVIRHILRKEFLQIFRNKGMLPIIFVMPVVQLLILVNAADFEVKNIRFKILDNDKSSLSRELLNHISASHQFNYCGHLSSVKEGIHTLDDGSANLFIHIPYNFSKTIIKTGKAQLSVEINGIDGQAAGLSAFYITNIIQQFNKNVAIKIAHIPEAPPQAISISTRYWYNPELTYSNYMVPGLLVILVTMVGGFLSSMNIVREKEIGTIEQINVTPIRKYQFIIGKLFPFWLIGLFELALGLLFGKLIFQIPVNGSLLLLFSYAAIYLPVILGLGLLMSSLTTTQQQAMFTTWFFMVIFILMSGLFTPIENMPDWAQKITWFNPISYFVRVVRMVLLKGSGWHALRLDFMFTFIFAIAMNVLALLAYRKRT